MAVADNPKANARLASSLNIVAGLWLIAAPWALGYSASTAMWNDVLVGIALVILAGTRVARPERLTGISWVNVVLGIWLFLAPFILQYQSFAVAGAGAAIWNDIIVGIAVVLLGWVSAANTARMMQE